MKKILITAGGTKENIDPVRYIGNHSSGKMGLAIADEAYNSGYEVTLITTFNINKPYKTILATSSDEMYNSTINEFKNTDILIMAAAVADFKPKQKADQKIKKGTSETLTLELVKTKDILKEISKIKKKQQIVIGFCAESENLLNNAQKKLNEKNLDYIVANDISRTDIGFGSDFNEVTILTKNDEKKLVKKATKNDIAKIILKTCLT